MPTYFEEFVSYDWARYAKASSQITCVVALIVGVVGLFIYHYSALPSVWSILASIILSAFDYPYCYSFLPKFREVHEFLENFVTDGMRSVLYAVLSIPCFLIRSIPIITGVMLIICAVLFAFTAWSENEHRRNLMAANRSTQIPYRPIPQAKTTVTEESKVEEGKRGNEYGTYQK